MAAAAKAAWRFAPIACAAACALVPPGVALPWLSSVRASVWLAFSYFCSMMLGAAPFLTLGALAAAAATALPLTCAERSRRLLLASVAALFPGCDCAMNAYAPALRSQPPALAAAVIVWSGVCNPLALTVTALVLGVHMLAARIIAGAVASALAALLWAGTKTRALPHECAQTSGYWARFVDLAGAAIASFALAAAIGAAYLTWMADRVRLEGPAVAALLGALVSPCSSADALLARVLFHAPASQLAFVVGGQCLDVRQLVMLQRCFGGSRALRALCAAVVALVIGCWVAR